MLLFFYLLVLMVRGHAGMPDRFVSPLPVSATVCHCCRRALAAAGPLPKLQSGQ